MADGIGGAGTNDGSADAFASVVAGDASAISCGATGDAGMFVASPQVLIFVMVCLRWVSD
jgi:hypothetical protein